MINHLTLIGRLGKEPEVRRLETGSVVAKFSLATSESYKDKSGEWQEVTQWHDVILWGKQAERAESLTKGALLYVEGKLTYRTYQDKEGNTRKVTEVVASYFRILDKRQDTPATTPASDTPKAEPGDDLPF